MLEFFLDFLYSYIERYNIIVDERFKFLFIFLYFFVFCGYFGFWWVLVGCSNFYEYWNILKLFY